MATPMYPIQSQNLVFAKCILVTDSGISRAAFISRGHWDVERNLPKQPVSGVHLTNRILMKGKQKSQYFCG